MAPTDKITILLADEDALRRDGLAAVLQGTARFDVIAQCQDGEAALSEIRRLRPDVAVVDLNLPKLHGIELVRRVRGETPGTKIVILSGSTDDDIIREVVRAGGDAYLLKNGPARHLIDAISYVRDGGQYFSPQLRRDGLDRHLLQETLRPPETPRGKPERTARTRATDYDPEARTTARDTRSGAHGDGYNDRRQGFRERLREDSETENLGEHDYEILDMMADGIRPILDRLEDIESRIGEMETGDAPVPSNLRGWLSTQIADTLQDSRSGGRAVALERTVNDLEARLPKLIEEAVTNRFHNMASKLQQEIEETHVRTLETFVKNIQVKLVQRVSALEVDMSKQAEAMNLLGESSQRTEDNLSRLISGVDKLAQELPKRLAASPPEPVEEPDSGVRPVRRKSRSSSRNVSPKMFGVAAALVLIALAVFAAVRWFGSTKPAGATPAATPAADAASGPASRPIVLAPGADTKAKMQAAEAYSERKEYPTAEDIYKQILKAEPNNVDAMKALASVLYREDKIEESAAVLDKLPRN